MPPLRFRPCLTALGTVIVVGAILTFAFIPRRRSQPHSPPRQQNRTMRRRKTKRNDILWFPPNYPPGPIPYGRRLSTLHTIPNTESRLPDGTIVLPSIVITTPNSDGNLELVKQTMGMDDEKPKRAPSLHLPYRRMKSTERREEGPMAHWNHQRPSRVERSGSPHASIARVMRAEERKVQVMKWYELEKVMATRPVESAKDDVGVAYGLVQVEGSSRRTVSMPPLPFRLQKDVEELMNSRGVLQVRSASPVQSASDDEDEEVVERGRRMTKDTSMRVQNSTDSEIWERRGRSRNPRPKPGEAAMEEPPVEEEDRSADTIVEHMKQNMEQTGYFVVNQETMDWFLQQKKNMAKQAKKPTRQKAKSAQPKTKPTTQKYTGVPKPQFVHFEIDEEEEVESRRRGSGGLAGWVPAEGAESDK